LPVCSDTSKNVDIYNISNNNYKYDENELRNIYSCYNYKNYGEILFSKLIYCKSVIQIKEENFTNNMIFSKNLIWSANMVDINLIKQAISSLSSSLSSSSILYLDDNRMISILQSILTEAEFFNQIYLLKNQSEQQQQQLINNNILWSTFDLPSLYLLINSNKYRNNQGKSCPSAGQVTAYVIEQGFLCCCLTSDSRCIVSNAHVDIVKEVLITCISNSFTSRLNSFQINDKKDLINNSSIYISNNSSNNHNITDFDCFCKNYNNVDKYYINKHDNGRKRIFLDIFLENKTEIRRRVLSESKWIENELTNLNVDLWTDDRDCNIDKDNYIDNDDFTDKDDLNNSYHSYNIERNKNDEIIIDNDVDIVNQINLINNEYNTQNVHVIILTNLEYPYDNIIENELLESLAIDISMINSVTQWNKDYDNDGRYDGDLIIKWCINKQIDDKKEWKNNKKNNTARPFSLFLIIVNNSCLIINGLIRLPTHIVFLGINESIAERSDNRSSLLFTSKGSFEICCSTSYIFNINIKFTCNGAYLSTCKDAKKNLLRIHGKDSILLAYNCNFNYIYENCYSETNNDIKKLKNNNKNNKYNNTNNEGFMNIINISSSGLFYCENCNIIENSLDNLEEPELRFGYNNNESNVYLVCIYLCGPSTSCICHNLTINSDQVKSNKNLIKTVGINVAASSNLSIYNCNVFKCEIGLKVVDGGICNSYQCNFNNNNKNGIEVFGVSSLQLISSYVCNNNGKKILFILFISSLFQ
jgi:hypothetical protein